MNFLSETNPNDDTVSVAKTVAASVMDGQSTYMGTVFTSPQYPLNSFSRNNLCIDSLILVYF